MSVICSGAQECDSERCEHKLPHEPVQETRHTTCVEILETCSHSTLPVQCIKVEEMKITCEECGEPVTVPLSSNPYESGDDLPNVVCKNCNSLIKVGLGLFITYQDDYHPVNEEKLDRLLKKAIAVRNFTDGRFSRIQKTLVKGTPGITCPETTKMSQATFAAQRALQDIDPENINKVKDLFLALYAIGVPPE